MVLKEIFDYFKKIDLVLFFCVIFLNILGFVSLYSSCFRNNDFSIFYKQIIFFVLGLVLMFLFSFFDYRILKDNPYLILIFYTISICLLFGVLFFGTEIRGSRSWYKIGNFGFQPTSFVKIVLIFIFAKFFSTRHVQLYKLVHIFHSVFYLLLPAILIILQPDLGFVIILFLIWFGILLVSGIKLRHFFLLLVCFLILSVWAWNFFLQDYQKKRIISFVFGNDPLGVSWNQNQSKIAIGSGGIFGKGIKKGTQLQHLFLPEPHTDFIFSAISEEMGFLGSFFLFFLWGVVFLRLFNIYSQTSFNFARLLVVGISIAWFSQIFINLGMNLGILPIIGISLPFVSYGGSDLLANFLLLGIIQNIKITS